MKTIQKIVVPVDFSEKTTDHLVAYACYVAERLGAVIYFFHVIEPYPADAMIGAPFAPQNRDDIKVSSKKKMNSLVHDNQGHCLGCTGQVESGEPVEKIVEFAKEINADLIIISTHGAKGLEKILLGSVVEEVLKQAHCPVLSMNPFKEQ